MGESLESFIVSGLRAENQPMHVGWEIINVSPEGHLGAGGSTGAADFDVLLIDSRSDPQTHEQRRLVPGLARRSSKPVVISTGQNQALIFEDPGLAADTYATLYPAGEAPKPDFRMNIVSPEDSLIESPDFAGVLLDRWRSGTRVIDSDFTAFLHDTGIAERTMIFDTMSADGRLVHSFIGEGYKPVYGSDWLLSALGRPLEWQPDKEFGAFVQRIYEDIARGGEPQFVHMSRQMKDGRTRFYERIACPFTSPTGADVIVCCSRIVG